MWRLTKVLFPTGTLWLLSSEYWGVKSMTSLIGIIIAVLAALVDR